MKQFDPRVQAARSKAENEKREGEKIIDFWPAAFLEVYYLYVYSIYKSSWLLIFWRPVSQQQWNLPCLLYRLALSLYIFGFKLQRIQVFHM